MQKKNDCPRGYTTQLHVLNETTGIFKRL